MEIFQTLWYALLFLICLFAYLSFSAVTHELLAKIKSNHKRMEEGFKLRPLTSLFENEEKLMSILEFCRLVFAFPLILLLFEFGIRTHLAVAILILLLTIPLLYLLPIWATTPRTYRMFRFAVQSIGYVLYPAFWGIDKVSGRIAPPELKEEDKKKTNGELDEVESEEFKGDIIEAVNTIEETTVREVMTPRVDMVTISALSTLNDLHEFFKEHKFSRVPVYRERVDSIVGIVGVMDFVSRVPETDMNDRVDTIMRPALFVPETKKVFALLREFRESHAQMAIVIDEYGGTSGLVTLEDLLEELVGEIADEFDEAPEEAYRENEGAYVVSGKFPIERLEEVFGIQVPDEDFETISGLIFSIVGRIPLAGEIVRYQALDLEIMEADKRRIHRVRMRQLPIAEENAEVAGT